MRFEHGDLVVDTDARELVCRGARRALSPKALELLALLVAGRPAPVTKTAIMDALWPEDSVLEANVPNLVAEIRSALGRDRRRWIRTVHGVGYAFDVPASADAGPSRGPRLVLTWPRGRAALGEGVHVLGRDEEADVVLDHPSVSRRHARVAVDGAGATIEDLRSKNGTFLGDRRVAGPTRLSGGSELRLGGLRLRVRSSGATPTDTLTT
jgi:DNA-binding winged helix-turn-helix (wHTH) protein